MGALRGRPETSHLATEWSACSFAAAQLGGVQLLCTASAPPRSQALPSGEVDGSFAAMEYRPAADVAARAIVDGLAAAPDGRPYSLVLHNGDIA